MSDLPISEKQHRSIVDSNGRVNIWEGAIRSAKTIASLVRWLLFVARAPRGGALVVIGRTRDAVGRNVFGPLMDPDLFGEWATETKYTTGAPTATILGRLVYVIGASDAKAEKVLRGLTVAGAYVDEVTVIPEEFFTQLLGRMSVPGAQLFGTTNPDSPAHWLKVKFLDQLDRLTDWRSFHFELADNPSLTPEYIESISREFTGLWYRRFIKGEWVAAEGAVFDSWDPEVHTIPWDDLPEMRDLLCVSFDYGTTNPTVAGILGLSAEIDPLGRPTPRMFLVDEWVYDSKIEQQKLTDAELSQRVRAWLDAGGHIPRDTFPAMRPRYAIVDPSAASFRVQLAQDGLTSSAADNDVLYGIRLLASLLNSGKFLIARPTELNPDRGCPRFISEAPGYSWDPKKTEKGEDAPLKVADHSLDQARYGVVTTENIWRQHIKLAA